MKNYDHKKIPAFAKASEGQGKKIKEYNHAKIEHKWQLEWDKKKIYQAKDGKDKKFYALIEFPYPSGDGLHVGHVRGQTAMDIVSRKRRMEGYNVLYPIGWDAFGLPTENYAIKTGKQPSVITKKNTDTFRRQAKSLGISFDWSREINTTDPNYYKWTQWLFLQFFKKGLAYKAKSEINWCPKDKTGLANEEVIDGKCERCGTLTIKKEKEQWMLGITKYAERLDNDLDLVDYPERVKSSQRNWIGKSEGSEIDFKIKGLENHPVVICHGWGDSSKKHFIPWLKEKLEENNCKVSALDFPDSSKPVYENWKKKFEEQNINFGQTIFVGHSLGGTFLMKYFTENKDKSYKKLVIISPPTSDQDIYKGAINSWFNKGKHEIYKINSKNTIFIFSDNDKYNKVEQFKEYSKSLNILPILIPGYEHFCVKEVPELLDFIISKIKVFTTRADTLFGATYVVLSPEHPLVMSKTVFDTLENKDEVLKYINDVKKKTDLERTENKEKTGVELRGIKAINPANNEEIPVFIADYVLAHYGTGAVMAVPAHDERDFLFAKKYNLPIKQVIEPIFIGEIDSNASTVERNSISAIIKHWSEDKYLCLKWKKANWITFVTGGIEKGQTPEEAARAEILEETGFKNLELVKVLENSHSKFYHIPKKENRFAHFSNFYFKLKDGEQKEILNEEKEKHEVIWLKAEEIEKLLTPASQKYDFEIINGYESAYTDYGIINNSGNFNYLDSIEAMKKITEFVGGKIVTKFKLRDWVFSRQRYWGEPIPVVNCEKCGLVPVKEKDLPVKLPAVKSYKPTDNGESPLAGISKWVNVKCPKCGGKAKRETDTMPNWAGSSWYYLRYTDPKNKKEFASKKNLKYWIPVDWYNGGMEHTTLHLLYSRFWHKFLFDLKLVPTVEPYMKRTSHGMILGEGGVKMSKSLGNVVNPDEIVKTYGADTLRVYEMFIGPFEDTAVWNTESIIGSRRFIEKVWRIGQKINSKPMKNSGAFALGDNRAGDQHDALNSLLASPQNSLRKLLHKTIKKVGEDIESMRFNTAISAMMILATEMEKILEGQTLGIQKGLSLDDFKKFLKILAPFAPHITEEIWQKFGDSTSPSLRGAKEKFIALSAWPKYDEELIKDDKIQIAVQVNGKVRAEIMINTIDDESTIKSIVLKDQNIQKFISSKEIKRFIYVKNRLVNIVI